jgi:hypothetical protein
MPAAKIRIKDTNLQRDNLLKRFILLQFGFKIKLVLTSSAKKVVVVGILSYPGWPAAAL